LDAARNDAAKKSDGSKKEEDEDEAVVGIHNEVD
jgi:hypothetical protein